MVVTQPRNCAWPSSGTAQASVLGLVQPCSSGAMLAMLPLVAQPGSCAGLAAAVQPRGITRTISNCWRTGDCARPGSSSPTTWDSMLGLGVADLRVPWWTKQQLLESWGLLWAQQESGWVGIHQQVSGPP